MYTYFARTYLLVSYVSTLRDDFSDNFIYGKDLINRSKQSSISKTTFHGQFM